MLIRFEVSLKEFDQLRVSVKEFDQLRVSVKEFDQLRVSVKEFDELNLFCNICTEMSEEIFVEYVRIKKYAVKTHRKNLVGRGPFSWVASPIFAKNF